MHDNASVMSAEQIKTSTPDSPSDESVLGTGLLSQDFTRQYLNEIGRIPLLDKDEEIELSKRIEAGLYAAELMKEADEAGATREELEWLVADGEVAKNHMLEANTRLVVSIARKYQGNNLPLLDLIQEGNVGLVRAVEKFDYRMGYKFSTYATWWIRQAITRGIIDTSRLVRLPNHIAESLNKVRKTERQLEKDLGRTPTIDEIAVECDLSVATVNDLLTWGRDHISLDAPLGDDATDTLMDIFADEMEFGTDESALWSERREELEQVLGALDERKADILRSRFGLNGGKPETLAVIGERWGIRQERVRQLQSEALQTLRGMTDGSGSFDGKRIEAHRSVASSGHSKHGTAKMGQRARQRVLVAEQLERYRSRLREEQIAVLGAFVTTSTRTSAAESLGISISQFDSKLRLAKQALSAFSRQ